MRCGVTDTSSGSGGLVGKRSSFVTDDVRIVTSLIVTRDGQDVASVSEHLPAQALADVGSVKVEGRVDNNVLGEKGSVYVLYIFPGAFGYCS